MQKVKEVFEVRDLLSENQALLRTPFKILDAV